MWNALGCGNYSQSLFSNIFVINKETYISLVTNYIKLKIIKRISVQSKPEYSYILFKIIIYFQKLNHYLNYVNAYTW